MSEGAGGLLPARLGFGVFPNCGGPVVRARAKRSTRIAESILRFQLGRRQAA
jgi:hypothetical protein